MSALTLFQPPHRGTLSRNGWGGLFDTFFDDFTSFPRTTFGQTFREQSYPTAKVNDLDDRYEINVVVPGLNKGDLNVHLDDQTLTISYESSTGEGTNAVNYSSFSKSWTLPDGTTEKDISAGYDSGVLTVNVQKTEPVKIPVKTIPVQ
jgi:HSP20 family protein